MSLGPVTAPVVSVQLPDAVLYGRPLQACVHIEGSAEDTGLMESSQRIETLIAKLKEHGPLIASGCIGPSFYNGRSHQIPNPLGDQVVYGWNSTVKRISHLPPRPLFILGALKSEERGYVYFTTADVTTEVSDFCVMKEYKPSKTDENVYIVSHDTFRRYLISVFLPHARPNRLEQVYIFHLSTATPRAIWQEWNGRCKSIGQELFNARKKNNGDSASAGAFLEEVHQRIADHDGPRGKAIASVWEGIGDENFVFGETENIDLQRGIERNSS